MVVVVSGVLLSARDAEIITSSRRRTVSCAAASEKREKWKVERAKTQQAIICWRLERVALKKR